MELQHKLTKTVMPKQQNPKNQIGSSDYQLKTEGNKGAGHLTSSDLDHTCHSLTVCLLSLPEAIARINKMSSSALCHSKLLRCFSLSASCGSLASICHDFAMACA